KTTGDMVVAGYFNGATDLGRGPIAGSLGNDLFVAKYDRSGRALWANVFGGGFDQIARGVAIDQASGDVFIVGSFQGSVSFGGPTYTSSSPDVVVARYAGVTGAHVWSRAYAGPGAVAAGGIAIDETGTYLNAVASFAPQIDLGGGVLTSAGAYDIF